MGVILSGGFPWECPVVENVQGKCPERGPDPRERLQVSMFSGYDSSHLDHAHRQTATNYKTQPQFGEKQKRAAL